MVNSTTLLPKALPRHNVKPNPSPLWGGVKVKMRILHVSTRMDVRALKQALIMLDRGHEVEYAAPESGFGFGYNRFTVAYAWGDHDQLRRIVERSSADVIHVHSDPNWLVPLVKQAAGRRPVIHDVHDPESMRTGQAPDKDEVEAYKVDGIIHVSERCREYAERAFGVHPKTIINYSMVPRMLFGSSPAPNFNAIAYEGGLTSLEEDGNGLAYYRNMHYMVHQFIAEGFQVSLFAAGRDELDMSYDQMGALVTRHLPYATMLTGLRLHGFGFVGAPVINPLIRAAMPNKLFEYISQGLVPVCWNMDEAGEFVEKNGIGIHLHGDLVNLREQLKRGPELRENLMKIRQQFAMESQAETLERFYQSFI